MKNTLFRFRLKDLREKKRISQYKFAEDLKIAQSTIGNWEAGKREPGYNTLIAIAKYFDVTVDYLLGLSDCPKGEKTIYNIELAPEAEDERKMLNLYRQVKQQGGAEAAIQFLDILKNVYTDKKDG